MNLKKINIFNRNIDVYQQVIDYAVPVNFVYVQYPQQKKPEDLYPNTTWEVIDYQGCFFRAEGGYASTFVEEGGTLTKQTYQNAYHNHTHSHTHTLSHTHTFNHRHQFSVTCSGGNHRHGQNLNGESGDNNLRPMKGNGGVASSANGLALYDSTTYYTTDYSQAVTDWQTVSVSGSGTTDYPCSNTSTTKTNTTSGASTSTTSDANTTSTSYNGSSTVKEARPDNYTIKVWKRTA